MFSNEKSTLMPAPFYALQSEKLSQEGEKRCQFIQKQEGLNRGS
jgi:hypothetical protein